MSSFRVRSWILTQIAFAVNGAKAVARHGHEQRARRVGPNPLLHGLVEGGDLRSQLSPGLKQRTNDLSHLGLAFEQRFDMPKVFRTPRIMLLSRVRIPTS